MRRKNGNQWGFKIVAGQLSGLITGVGSVLLLLGLLARVNAADAPPRPTLKEVKPLMEKAASGMFDEGDQVTVQKLEVVEIGAPGWAPLTGPGNEDPFWPVKVKCAFAGQGRTGPEEMVLIVRVYRDGNAWKADTREVYTIGSVQGVLKARQTARRLACINLLRMIDGAKEQWALENRKTMNDTPTMADLVGPGKYIRATPTCPDGGTYTINSMSKRPRCSCPGHELP